jgi:hypothetical protein
VVRAALYALVSIFLLTLVKLFAGIVMRALNDAVGGSSGTQTANRGELKKCAVCGTYAPKAAAPVLKGTDAFVCSDACAMKYRA